VLFLLMTMIIGISCTTAAAEEFCAGKKAPNQPCEVCVSLKAYRGANDVAQAARKCVTKLGVSRAKHNALTGRYQLLLENLQASELEKGVAVKELARVEAVEEARWSPLRYVGITALVVGGALGAYDALKPNPDVADIIVDLSVAAAGGVVAFSF